MMHAPVCEISRGVRESTPASLLVLLVRYNKRILSSGCDIPDPHKFFFRRMRKEAFGVAAAKCNRYHKIEQ